LWTRNPEIAVLDACRELGAAFVPYSPLARAFLADGLPDPAVLDEGDLRRGMPRFQPEAYTRNLRLLEPYRGIAVRVGCSPAQLALAWLLHQGEDIIPIPGTTRLDHLADNLGAADIMLDEATLAELDVLINDRTVEGARHGAANIAEVDTESFQGAP